MSPLILRVIAVVAVIHGIAHFAGVGDAVDPQDPAAGVDGPGGLLAISDPTALRVIGVLWAVAGVAFIVTGVLMWRNARRWPGVLMVVSAFSLALSVLALWAAAIGVVVSAAFLVLAIVSRPAHVPVEGT